VQSKTPLLMITALVCGLGAAYGTWKLVSGAQAAPASEETKVKVLVPVADIQPYSLFQDEKKFTSIDWPKHKLREAQEDTITSFDQIKGKQARHYKLRPNEPIYKNDVCENADSDIATRLKPGEVAAALRTDPSDTSGGFIQPGDHVNIAATVAGGQGEDTETFFILDNIEVLAVDNLATKDPNGAVLPTNRMVFRVSTGEALKLKAYADSGKLSIYKRRIDDTTNVLNQSFSKRKKNAVAKAEEEQPAVTPVTPEIKNVPLEEKTEVAKGEPKPQTPKGPEYDVNQLNQRLDDGTNVKNRVFPNVTWKTLKSPETNKDNEKDKGANATKENGEKKAEGKKNEPGK
jgi:Flp pilus assembly protein CpaB